MYAPACETYRSTLNTRVLSTRNGWLWAGDGVKHDGIVSESGDYWHVVAVSG